VRNCISVEPGPQLATEANNWLTRKSFFSAVLPSNERIGYDPIFFSSNLTPAQLLAFKKLKRLSGCMLGVDKPVATGEIKKLQAKLR
jgi:hypothetical protein